MRRAFFRILAVFLATTLISLTCFLYAYDRFVRPGQNLAQVNLFIDKGMSLGDIGELLEEQGLLDSRWDFIIGVRLAKSERALKFGEYVFPARVSAKGVMQLLKAGRTLVRRQTIPEGLTSFEVYKIVLDTFGLEGEMPPPAREGTLLPETYHYSWGDLRSTFIGRMDTGMKNLMAEEWSARDSGLPLASPKEALILASIVEKETALAKERPLVAGVFINRLNKGMRLQSDPTVVYGLTDGQGDLGRALTRKDIATKTLFNTYVIKGLPPGPICNPGADSIRAVLHPEKTDALYFVADGNGGHAFSKTLNQHNRNVAKWRKLKNGG